MEFTAEELFEIAVRTFRSHGIEVDYSVREGLRSWAAESEEEDYSSEKEVVKELEGYDESCPECGECVKLADIVDGRCPQCRDEYEEDDESDEE
jgi:tRNA(Ile2) C34 agmatinyltransferase TiaS